MAILMQCFCCWHTSIEEDRWEATCGCGNRMYPLAVDGADSRDDVGCTQSCTGEIDPAA